MPQSLHVLSAHIIFSTKHRRPDLRAELRPKSVGLHGWDPQEPGMLFDYRWRLRGTHSHSLQPVQEVSND